MSSELSNYGQERQVLRGTILLFALACLTGAPSHGVEGWFEAVRLRGSPGAMTGSWEAAGDLQFEPPLEAPGVVCLGSDKTALACHLISTTTERVEPPPRWGVVLVGSVGGEENSAIPEVWLHIEGLSGVRTHKVPLEPAGKTEELIRRVEVHPNRTFELPPLAPGTFRLVADWPGGARSATDAIEVPHARELVPRSQEILQHPRLDAPILEPPDGLAMRVLAVDDRGLPVFGARVLLNLGPLETQRTFRGWTDDEGKLTFLGVDAEKTPARLLCEAKDHARSLEEIDPREPLVVCELARHGAVVGVVEDSRGAPIVGARIAVGRNWAESGDDGAFTLAGLRPGEPRLEVMAPGYRIWGEKVPVSPDGTTTLDPVRLELAARWQVRVIEEISDDDQSAGRAPIEGARVKVEATGEVASTDQEGLAEIAAEPGAWLEVESESGYAVVVAELPGVPEDRPFEIVLERAGDARIHVAQGGEPCVGCLVGIYCAALAQEGRTDRLGTVEFHGLPPGRCWASRSTERITPWGATSWSGRDRVSAEIVPGEVAEIILEEAPGQLEIAIPGLPAGWLVGARSATLSTVGEQREGRWLLSVRERGTVDVFVSRYTTTIELTRIEEPKPGESLTLSLPTSALALTYEGAHATVGTLLRQGEKVASFLLRPDERQVVPFLAPGTYILAIAGHPVVDARLLAGQIQDLGLVSAPVRSDSL